MTAQIRQGLLTLVSCIVVLGCTGCITIKLRDESSGEKYREHIGRIFTMKSEFKVYGVAKDLSRRPKTADYYTMLPTALPGIGGPEIIDFGFLPAATRVRLVAAYEEVLLGATVYEVVVVEPADPRFMNLRIQINNSSRIQIYESTYQSGAPKLNEKWFIEEKSK